MKFSIINCSICYNIPFNMTGVMKFRMRSPHCMSPFVWLCTSNSEQTRDLCQAHIVILEATKNVCIYWNRDWCHFTQKLMGKNVTIENVMKNFFHILFYEIYIYFFTELCSSSHELFHKMTPLNMESHKDINLQQVIDVKCHVLLETTITTHSLVR